MPMTAVVPPQHVPLQGGGVPARAGGDEQAGSDFEAIRQRGFSWLRFPAQMEARYAQDMAGERLQRLRTGGLMLMLITLISLGMDRCMVPDQFPLALMLRLLVLMPVALLYVLQSGQWSESAREWAFTAMLAVSSLSQALLVVLSRDQLAPLYLTGLLAYVLLSGNLVRGRFWHLVLTSVLAAVLYGVACSLVHNPPVEVLLTLGLAMLATTVFSMWGAYRLEHNQRDQWLMTQHERHLQQLLESGIHRLDELSRFDPLTSLPNRRELYQHLHKVWARASHDGGSVAVLLMDVDHFKAYNDAHGHVHGDECLRQVAWALRDTVSDPHALAARWGGEEFMVVLSQTNLGRAARLAQRVVDAVQALRHPHGSSPTSPWVTCSVGVASVQASAEGASVDALIAAADAALYRAKQQGRSRWAAHESGELLPVVHADAPAPVPEASQDARADVTTYDRELAQLERPLNRLLFEPALEHRYQHDTAPTRLHDFLVTGVLALVMFNTFLPGDYLLVNDVWEQALWLRLGVFTPMWVVIILATWLGKPLVLKWLPPWTHDALVTLSGVLAGACLSYILAVSQSPLAKYYHMGLMVVVIYGNLVQRLRFWFAMVHALAIFALHVHGVMLAQDMETRLLVPMVTMVATAVLFTLMANYTMDRDDRVNYLLSLRRNDLLKQLKAVHAQFSKLARVDPLTGLFNRRHVNESLDHAWTRAIRQEGSLAVIMVDIDHFKAYNDNHGHPAGDHCIAQVAQALADSVRGPTDMVGRYGGEEFIAVLPQVSAQEANRVAERMRAAVERLHMAHGASSAGPDVSVSVGVACLNTRADLSADHVLQRADQALYRAKHEGRNRVVGSPTTV